MGFFSDMKRLASEVDVDDIVSAGKAAASGDMGAAAAAMADAMGLDDVLDKVVGNLKRQLTQVAEEKVYNEAKKRKVADGPLRETIEQSVGSADVPEVGVPGESVAKKKFAGILGKQIDKTNYDGMYICV